MGWVKTLFRRMRMSLFYPLLTHSVPVADPSVVPKKAPDRKVREGMELADIVCFCVARTVHNVREGQEIEFDPSLLGKIGFIYHDHQDESYRMAYQAGLKGIIYDDE